MTKKITKNISFDPEILKKAKLRAKDERRTFSSFVNYIIGKELKIEQ